MSLKQSISDFKELAEGFKSILELADALEKVGDVDALVLKSTQDANAAKKNELDAKASLAVALKKVSDAEAQATDVELQAKKRAESIVSGAQHQANEELKVAKESISKLAELKVSSDLELAGVRKELDAAKKELSSIQGEIQGVKSKLSAFMRH